ncbi:hypothetical protein ACFQ8A_41665, partial [Streptomyces erythrochromogenes]
MNAEQALRAPARADRPETPPDAMAAQRPTPPVKSGRMPRRRWLPHLPADLGVTRRELIGDTCIALIVALASCLQFQCLTATGLVTGYPHAAAIAAIAATTLVLRRRLPELGLFAGLAASFASDERTLLFAASYAVARYGGRLRFVLVGGVTVVYLATRHLVGMADITTAQLYDGAIVEIA